ncbi:hypothetical protein [Hyphomicrobium sp.]|jgi:hypothetical protein|uniref:hypothetical protein n=1 Tax=Hyphomicrobium sp. TaxID=82 RepID=UPI002C34F199|nr:hypothetical protein [Hyphomicrobium sp.]HVZ04157.1 hypothetical protein [Hyphomicrobium sp.]
MLRRYLITNGIMTALLYGAVWAFAPSVSGVVRSAGSTIEAFAMDNPLFAPMIHRMVLISDR